MKLTVVMLDRDAELGRLREQVRIARDALTKISNPYKHPMQQHDAGIAAQAALEMGEVK